MKLQYFHDEMFSDINHQLFYVYIFKEKKAEDILAKVKISHPDDTPY